MSTLKECQPYMVLERSWAANHPVVRKDRGIPLPFFYNTGLNFIHNLPDPFVISPLQSPVFSMY
ncbi:MAG: hypothetical protein WD077_12330 [Bacteroidia bacterium]